MIKEFDKLIIEQQVDFINNELQKDKKLKEQLEVLRGKLYEKS